MRHLFAHPLALTLLATVLPALGGLALLAARRRRRAMTQLGSSLVLHGLTTVHHGRRRLRGVCMALGLVLLVVGIAGPQWGRDRSRSAAPGRDVVMVLDLSRSMLARDVLPNRASRAKEAVLDLAETLQKRGGHRLALVAFAGRPKVICPLTHDLDHVREAIRSLDADAPPPDLWPGDDAVSGTRIGQALQLAVATHDDRFTGYQDILLLSDGDDPARDDEWRSGATAAREARIPVHVIGIGNPEAGSPIPLGTGAYLRHKDQMVLTRLEEGPLVEIARLGRGTWTPARTRTLPLGQHYQESIESAAIREDSAETLALFRLRYPWFFGPALLLLALALVINDRRKVTR